MLYEVVSVSGVLWEICHWHLEPFFDLFWSLWIVSWVVLSESSHVRNMSFLDSSDLSISVELIQSLIVVKSILHLTSIVAWVIFGVNSVLLHLLLLEQRSLLLGLLLFWIPSWVIMMVNRFSLELSLVLMNVSGSSDSLV